MPSEELFKKRLKLNAGVIELRLESGDLPTPDLDPVQELKRRGKEQQIRDTFGHIQLSDAQIWSVRKLLDKLDLEGKMSRSAEILAEVKASFERDPKMSDEAFKAATKLIPEIYLDYRNLESFGHVRQLNGGAFSGDQMTAFSKLAEHDGLVPCLSLQKYIGEVFSTAKLNSFQVAAESMSGIVCDRFIYSLSEFNNAHGAALNDSQFDEIASAISSSLLADDKLDKAHLERLQEGGIQHLAKIVLTCGFVSPSYIRAALPSLCHLGDCSIEDILATAHSDSTGPAGSPPSPEYLEVISSINNQLFDLREKYPEIQRNFPEFLRHENERNPNERIAIEDLTQIESILESVNSLQPGSSAISGILYAASLLSRESRLQGLVDLAKGCEAIDDFGAEMIHAICIFGNGRSNEGERLTEKDVKSIADAISKFSSYDNPSSYFNATNQILDLLRQFDPKLEELDRFLDIAANDSELLVNIDSEDWLRHPWILSEKRPEQFGKLSATDNLTVYLSIAHEYFNLGTEDIRFRDFADKVSIKIMPKRF